MWFVRAANPHREAPKAKRLCEVAKLVVSILVTLLPSFENLTLTSFIKDSCLVTLFGHQAFYGK